jgi:DNA-binding transcriptional LysR family regulator
MYICMTMTYEQLDWNSLKAFLAAAREGSFSKAARHIGVTQPTLSRQIYNLEDALKVTLFERMSTGLVLTDAGQHLLDYTMPMGAAAQQISLAVAGLTANLEGEVSLSVSEIDALFRMPAIITFLREQAPTIQLTIHVSNQVSDLKRRDADIAIRSFRPNELDLIARRLVDQPIWFYGRPDMIARYAQPTHSRELSNIEIIGFERDGELIRRLESLGWCLTDRNFPIVTSFQGLQWELVKAGVGLGLFPQAIGDNEPSFIRAFEHLGPPITIPLWLVTHRELHTNPHIRKIFDLIVQWFHQHR